MPDRPPLVSFLLATYNSAAFLEPAIRAAAAQTVREIEILIADDASQDGTAEIVARLAAADPRIRFLPSNVNGGPGAARNRALAAARGTWVAILDSDDLMHPDRLRRLLAAAATHDADMIADDLILFDEDRLQPPRRFLAAPETDGPFQVTPARYLEQTVLYGAKPNLGFLKPVIRRTQLAGIGYDETLRIGEDDDLVTQLLARGARYWIVPTPLYYYRKHGASISYRTSGATLAAMQAAAARIAARFPDADPPTARALAHRACAVADATAFDAIVSALKARRPAAALATFARAPRTASLLLMPVKARIERLGRRLRRARPQPRGGARNVLVVSRQRIVGRTNGSSAYLLDLAAALRGAGLAPHLLQPSPTIVGRRPVFRMSPDLDVFASHRIRGVWRFGRLVVSRERRVWRAAAQGIAARLLGRFGIAKGRADIAFPHSITIPWTDADRVFTAQAGHDLADVIVADYIFQAEAIPALIRPEAPSAIVMHDLYAERGSTFGAGAARDSVTVGRDEEVALLGAADAVVAIQHAEAAWVAAHVPGSAVIVTPMAAASVAAPQPGEDDRLLFVGSNTPPNVMALEWFFAEIWPTVRAQRPQAMIEVAGSVAAAFGGPPPPGVAFLGLVPDLAPLYARAGVVISPLTAGSGLKIKLVDALAQGKAIVATGVTLQGVEAEAGPAVIHADEAHAFARAIIGLAGDAAARTALATRALAAARRHFSAEACYGPFIAWAKGTAPPPAAPAKRL